MPARIRRSRAIWDEARRPDAPWTATARAILYEVQPIRLSTVDVAGVASSVRTSAAGIGTFLGRTLPSAAGGAYRFLRGLSGRSWAVLGGVGAYLYAVRWVHQALDAGPMVVIISALVAIFTVGLGDGENADGVSAYSVFNRGFQRLMGSVDVESLVAQYAGGAMAVQAQGMGMGGPEGDEVAGGGGGAMPAAVAGQRRRGPGARAAPFGDDREAAAAAAAGARDLDNEDNNDVPRRQEGQNGSRRSGKKARRRDLQVRRETQRQRQAAQRLGFAGDGGQQEIDAMNRLIEDQAFRADVGEEQLEDADDFNE